MDGGGYDGSMRRTLLALAAGLVLLAGTVPAFLGALRGFSTDAVDLRDGTVLEGAATLGEGTVRVDAGGTIREIPRADVVEVRPRAAFTGAHLRTALADPFLPVVLRWTVAIALLGTLGAVLLGVPFALLTARTDLPGRRLLATLYAAPLAIPPLLAAMAWDGILPREMLTGPGSGGRSGTALRAAALFALAYFPLVTLFTRRSLAAAGASAEEAALLAAGPRRTLWRVTLPLARPGILLGALFTFVFCLNDFSVVDYLNIVRDAAQQVPVYPYALQSAFGRKTGGVEALLVGGLPLQAISLAAMAFALHRAAAGADATVGSAWRPPRPYSLGPAGRVAGMAFAGAVLAAAVAVPVGALLAEAGGAEAFRQAFRQAFRAGSGAAALRTTLLLSAAAVILAVPCAAVLAEAGRRLGRGGEVGAGLVALLPLATVPALVPLGGMALFDREAFTFTRGGGPFNPVYDTPLLAFLVLFSRVLPFALAATWASLRETEPSLHEAAEAAGIPWPRRMARIVLPLARPGLALGGLLAFVFAVRELDALALMEEQTLLRALWAQLHFMRDPTVAAMGIVLVAILGAAFAAAAALGLLRPRGA
jgi:iron(III) transport system permease protein